MGKNVGTWMLGRRTAMLVLLTVVSLLGGAVATPASTAGPGGGGGEEGPAGTLSVSTSMTNPRVGDILPISTTTNVSSPEYNVQLGTGPTAEVLFAGPPRFGVIHASTLGRRAAVVLCERWTQAPARTGGPRPSGGPKNAQRSSDA